MRKRRVFKIAETGLMFVALWWGIVLLLPSNTFDNTIYRTMENLMPELFWGVQSTGIALILLVGLITNNKMIRNVGLIISMGFWTFVSVALWLSEPSSTFTSHFVWALLSAGLYIHLMKVGDG